MARLLPLLSAVLWGRSDAALLGPPPTPLPGSGRRGRGRGQGTRRGQGGQDAVRRAIIRAIRYLLCERGGTPGGRDRGKAAGSRPGAAQEHCRLCICCINIKTMLNAPIPRSPSVTPVLAVVLANAVAAALTGPTTLPTSSVASATATLSLHDLSRPPAVRNFIRNNIAMSILCTCCRLS